MNETSSSSSEQQYKDIIGELAIRGVQQSLAHKILEYLDYLSLTNASLVSAAWCKAVKSGQLWRKLFERNIEFDAVWRRFYQRDKIAMFQLIGPLLSSHSPQKLFQRHCDYIHQRQENLVSNWRHKRFTGAAVIDPDRCLHIQPFAMDQSRFVSYVAAKEEFYVIKRWQQTFEKTIPCPKMRVEDYKFSSGILVAICFTMDGHYRGSIRVWNVDTAQLVHVFDDSLALRDPQLVAVDSPTFRTALSDCGRYLATFVTISQFPFPASAMTKEEDNKRLLTLRKFGKVPEQVTVVHQLHHQLDSAPARLIIAKSLFVDDRYVILFHKMFDESSLETIEIRSTRTLQLLHSIAPVPLSSILLHYSSGYLMLSLLNSSIINFWSAESGTCVGSLRLHQGLQCVSIRARLIGDRFVFVYCRMGFVRVYDLQSLLFVNSQQKKMKELAAPADDGEEEEEEEEEDECLYQFGMLREEGPMSHVVTDQCQVFLFGSNAQDIGANSPRTVYAVGIDFAGGNRPQLSSLFAHRQ